MTNDKCPHRHECYDYKHDHCDGCNLARVNANGIDMSGDAISRKAAQARIKAICDKYHLSYEDGPRKVSTGGSAYALGHAFDDLPSVADKQKEQIQSLAWRILALRSKIEILEKSKRPQGKWTKITKDGVTPIEYVCSNCGRTVKSHYEDYFVTKEYPFCHCGADMRGAE